MSIAPINHSVTVKGSPERAFRLFTESMVSWWGKTIGPAPPVAIVIEPRAGGRWFERDAAGVETPWGEVLAWEPPHRVLLAWRINAQWMFDPSFLTEVEIVFEQVGSATRVTLEHRNLERFGDDATPEKLRGGWPGQNRLLRPVQRHALGE